MKKMLVCLLTISFMLWGSIHGSIFVAHACADGIAIGMDSRFSRDGRFISNREATNFHIVSNTVATCHVGGSGSDFHALLSEVRLMQMERNCKEGPDSYWSISSIAHYISALIKSSPRYRDVHMIISGFDATDNGDNGRFSLIEILPGGACIAQDSVVAGSSADCVLGSFQENVLSQVQDNESDEKGLQAAVHLVSSAVLQAIRLDARSGPPTKLYVLQRAKSSPEYHMQSDVRGKPGVFGWRMLQR
jgi:20S proteasome alpha/beta subunit